MDDIKTNPANYIALLKMWQTLRRDYEQEAEHVDTWKILARMEHKLTTAQIISCTKKAFPKIEKEVIAEN